MNIDDLTIGEAKELAQLFSPKNTSSTGCNSMLGKKCIFRSYASGDGSGSGDGYGN